MGSVTGSSTAAGGEVVITAMAYQFSDGIYGWMLMLTAIQDLAISAFILSACRR